MSKPHLNKDALVVFEHKKIIEALPMLPVEVQVNYVMWKRVVRWHSIAGLQGIAGFNDRADPLTSFNRRSHLGMAWHLEYSGTKNQIYTLRFTVSLHEECRR
jgi:hypothetical protein